jgi:L-fuconolactonase
MEEMGRAGVDRAVIVPPSFMGNVNPNAYALEVAAKWPDRFAVMGRFDPRQPGGQDVLARWLEQPGMTGLRLNLRREPEVRWLPEGVLDWFWPVAAKHRIPLAVLPGEQLPLLARVIEANPELVLIIDHMGLPAAGPDPFANFEQLLAMAKYPNVVVKLSALPRYIEEAYPFGSLHGYIRRAYDTFGPQRLAWGSDVTTMIGQRSYRESVDLIREACDFLSVTDREWILDKTLTRVLNW